MSEAMNPTDAVNVLKYLEHVATQEIGSPESKASVLRVAEHRKQQVRRMQATAGDGGAAFPHPAVYDPSRDQVNAASAYGAEGGMTLRDYFAAKAMHALLMADGTSRFENRSKEAYEMADAMLKERDK